jgi:alpha-ketoglutarate-dependent taurine dioxygenase
LVVSGPGLAHKEYQALPPRFGQGGTAARESQDKMHMQEKDTSPFADLAELDVIDPQFDLPLVIQHKKNATAALGLTGVDAFLNLWADHCDWMDRRLHQHGAMLFRGFGISEQTVFQSLMARLKEQLADYVDGNSPRTKMGGGVYTSTEYPPEYFICLHNELSYSQQWPARVFFCCIVAPKAGGQTPLMKSRSLLQTLPQELVKEFQARKVKYIRNLHGGKGVGKSWQKTFETESRAHVEDWAMAAGVVVQWFEDGSVRLSNVRPATAFHPVTGEEVWFNQADQFHPSSLPPAVYESMLSIFEGMEEELPQNATFGDGTPIPLAYLETIRAVTREHLALFDWQCGDLLMVDNMLVAHGRMPFVGDRRILVSMTSNYSSNGHSTKS